MVLDPPKGLFLPHGTGILLVRSPAAVRAAHAVGGAYLQDVDADQPLPDYAELGPELTRDYRGLHVWLPLDLHGVGAFRQALDEKLDLAAWAYRRARRLTCGDDQRNPGSTYTWARATLGTTANAVTSPFARPRGGMRSMRPLAPPTIRPAASRYTA